MLVSTQIKVSRLQDFRNNDKEYYVVYGNTLAFKECVDDELVGLMGDLYFDNISKNNNTNLTRVFHPNNDLYFDEFFLGHAEIFVYRGYLVLEPNKKKDKA